MFLYVAPTTQDVGCRGAALHAAHSELAQEQPTYVIIGCMLSQRMCQLPPNSKKEHNLQVSAGSPVAYTFSELRVLPLMHTLIFRSHTHCLVPMTQ